MPNAIVLFARSPGREAAAKRMPSSAPLFRAVIAAWLDAARRHGATPVIACANEDRAALADIAPHIERRWIEQGGRTFGERVVAAAGEAFASFDAIVLAAIDAPPPRDLDDAFDALRRGISVVGPARDGGVNFIGLTALDAELLMRLTLRRCRERCARLLVLRAVTDLDSQRSLAAARNERAWRELFDSRATRETVAPRPFLRAVRTLPPRAPPIASMA
jgi:glycosyltransferase A (GT-A) superfamily protein (DUF2064 family)